MAKRRGAKRRAIPLPGEVDTASTVVEVDEDVNATATAVEPVEPVEPTGELSIVGIPFGDLPEGYEQQQAAAGRLAMGGHINVQLDRENAERFLRVRQGLRDDNRKLSGGRPVWTSADAFRWLLENMAPA